MASNLWWTVELWRSGRVSYAFYKAPTQEVALSRAEWYVLDGGCYAYLRTGRGTRGKAVARLEAAPPEVEIKLL